MIFEWNEKADRGHGMNWRRFSPVVVAAGLLVGCTAGAGQATDPPATTEDTTTTTAAPTTTTTDPADAPLTTDEAAWWHGSMAPTAVAFADGLAAIEEASTDPFVDLCALVVSISNDVLEGDYPPSDRLIDPWSEWAAVVTAGSIRCTSAAMDNDLIEMEDALIEFLEGAIAALEDLGQTYERIEGIDR